MIMLLNIHPHNPFLFHKFFILLFPTFLKRFASKIVVDSGLQIRWWKVILIFKKKRTFPKKNGFVFEVTDEFLEPYFYKGEILVFLKEKFKNWHNLDESLVLVEISGELCIGRLSFEEGVPYLYTFNSKLYPKKILDDSTKYIGEVGLRLNQDLKGFKFK